ncbi:MAG: ATP-binding protein [Rhodospirillaceae bacterium]
MPPRDPDISAAARRDLPGVVRRAVHDLTQPLQALRMMLALPGVVAADARDIPGKLGSALDELDSRLAQMQALARALNPVAETEPPRAVPFLDLVALARRVNPAPWRGAVRVLNPSCPVRVPPRAAAWVLAVLVDNAARARPRSRIVVGPRCGGRWIVVADDGDGMTAEACGDLADALAGGPGAGLGCGLSLARLLVGGWGGAWRVSARPGGGMRIAFSTATAAF